MRERERQIREKERERVNKKMINKFTSLYNNVLK